MKGRHFLVPLALALLGVVAWLRPSGELGGTPRSTAAADPVHLHEEVPGPARTSTDHEPPPKPVYGRLRVVIEDGDVPGRLLVFGTNDRLDVDRRIAAGAETRIEKIFAGSKNVLFLPDRSRLAASTVTVVPPSGLGEARLRLQPCATLSGTVVDVLQRPLPGVRLEIRRPLFTPTPRPQKGASLFAAEESEGRGAAADRRWATVEIDGALRLGAASGADGTFALEGVEPGSFEVEVSWNDVRFRQACTAGAENRIVVPALPEAPPTPDPAELAAQARIGEWLRLMVLHHEAPEPYAAPLRAFLRERLAGRPLSVAQRADLEARIETIGRWTR